MRITLGHWVIEVDVQATASAYASMAQGSAADCGCTDCRNWIEQRDTALSRDFLELIKAIGIDPNKETEVSEYEVRTSRASSGRIPSVA